MTRTHRWAWGLTLAVLLGGTPAGAALIDFETTPTGATPLDDAFLGTPYPMVEGGDVRFFFDLNGNNAFDAGVDVRPVFEAYGPDSLDGFSNGITLNGDTANGGLAGQLGDYFLRQLQPGSPPPPFLVDYNTAFAISALSGEIWDIDGFPGNTEQWLVEVLDASNVLLASQLSPLGNSAALDGLPWVFSFSSLPAGADKVRITFSGTKTSGLGLAFNNFNPTAVPEPSTAALMGLGGLLLAGRRLRPGGARAS